MTAKDKVARRKLSLLELATDKDNVSKACEQYSAEEKIRIVLADLLRCFGPDAAAEAAGQVAAPIERPPQT